MNLASILHKKAGRAQIRQEVAVGALGYRGLNGAALTTLGALSQYGLIDRVRGEGVAVSALALRLLHPLNDNQMHSSKREAVLNPKVFSELFSDGFHHSDIDIIRNHLIQNEFTPDGAVKAANVFKANVEFANLGVDDIKPADAQDGNNPSSVTAEPLGQLEYPKSAHVTVPVAQSSSATGVLSLQLEGGKIITIPRMTYSDYVLLLETLKLWEKRIIVDGSEQPKPEISLSEPQ